MAQLDNLRELLAAVKSDIATWELAESKRLEALTHAKEAIARLRKDLSLSPESQSQEANAKSLELDSKMLDISSEVNNNSVEVHSPTIRRQRVLIPRNSAVIKASKRTKEDDVRKVFQDIETKQKGHLRLEDLRSYLCDYLGFGQAEADYIFKEHTQSEGSGHGVPFEGFKAAFATLNPFMISSRSKETIIRKPGSLGGEMLSLDGVEDCQVLICDSTAQALVDFMKRSTMLLAPCASSVFVRDCEDCVFYIAAQQLRTRDCKRCKFYLYSKTEPIIESSENLQFAPWAAKYPGCIAQFAKVNFDAERNLWNAIFDFSGKVGAANWAILPPEDLEELHVLLDELPEHAAPPDSPVGPITYEALCRDPVAAEESAGESVANIPQTRPSVPKPPSKDVMPRIVKVYDGKRIA